MSELGGGCGANGAPIRKRSGKLCHPLSFTGEETEARPTCPGGLPGLFSWDTVAWRPSLPTSPTSLQSAGDVGHTSLIPSSDVLSRTAPPGFGTTTGQLDDANTLSGQGHTVVCAPQTDPD